MGTSREVGGCLVESLTGRADNLGACLLGAMERSSSNTASSTVSSKTTSSCVMVDTDVTLLRSVAVEVGSGVVLGVRLVGLETRDVLGVVFRVDLGVVVLGVVVLGALLEVRGKVFVEDVLPTLGDDLPLVVLAGSRRPSFGEPLGEFKPIPRGKVFAFLSVPGDAGVFLPYVFFNVPDFEYVILVEVLGLDFPETFENAIIIKLLTLFYC